MKERKNSMKVPTIKSFEEKYGIGFTTNHTGKMAGMISLSTSCELNLRCLVRSTIPGTICEKCFAFVHFKRCTDNRPKFERNTKGLTTLDVMAEDVPILNAFMFRFECFGDLNNEQQTKNYFTIARKNKGTKCALWTKNPDIIAKTIEAGNKKPSNLVIVYSSPIINQEVPLEKIQKAYPFVDKTFTVFSKEYLKDKPNDFVNCGGKQCLQCGICYKKTGCKTIREKQK